MAKWKKVRRGLASTMTLGLSLGPAALGMTSTGATPAPAPGAEAWSHDEAVSLAGKCVSYGTEAVQKYCAGFSTKASCEADHSKDTNSPCKGGCSCTWEG